MNHTRTYSDLKVCLSTSIKNEREETIMIKEIPETKNRRILATKIQSACNESHKGVDIIFNILLKYVPSTILKEELKRAKESKFDE